MDGKAAGEAKGIAENAEGEMRHGIGYPLPRRNRKHETGIRIFFHSFCLIISWSLLPAQGAKIHKDFYLKIDHTGCRGTCPNYWITIEADGTTTWVGNQAAELMGTWRKKLVEPRMKEIAGAIESFQFWEFDEEYGGGIADIPSVIITCTHRGKEHAVIDTRNAPQKLKELEAKLETLLGVGGWNRVE